METKRRYGHGTRYMSDETLRIENTLYEHWRTPSMHATTLTARRRRPQFPPRPECTRLASHDFPFVPFSLGGEPVGEPLLDEFLGEVLPGEPEIFVAPSLGEPVGEPEGVANGEASGVTWGDMWPMLS